MSENSTGLVAKAYFTYSKPPFQTVTCTRVFSHACTCGCHAPITWGGVDRVGKQQSTLIETASLWRSLVNKSIKITPYMWQPGGGLTMHVAIATAHGLKMFGYQDGCYMPHSNILVNE